MQIETLTYDKCGATLRIETDDAGYLEKRKAEFVKKHGECVK